MNRRAPVGRALVDAAAAIVRARTGLTFGESRRDTLESGLAGAMRRARTTDEQGYLARLANDPTVLDDLIAEITVGESYFFRDSAQFAVIRTEILPAVAEARARPDPLRVWSAGCAGGEEPYTVAILLREMAWAGETHIVGTDLSRAALDRARDARYGAWSFRATSPEIADAYFEREGKHHVLKRAIRDAVELRYLNLAEDIYPSLATGIWGMDLILCRNVLIYLDPQTVASIARRLLDSLSDRGWLLLGASDPLIADLTPCETVVLSSGLAYRRGRRHARVHPSAAAVPAVARESDGEPEALAPDVAAAPSSSTIGDARSVDPLDEGRAALEAACASRDYDRVTGLARARIAAGDAGESTWIALIRALANRGELADAGRQCATALETYRVSAELTYLHAVLLAEIGRHADAATAARRALYLDRDLIVAHLALATALARLGEHDGARRAGRNALRLLDTLPADAVVPGSDGEPASRLTAMARAQLDLLRGAVA